MTKQKEESLAEEVWLEAVYMMEREVMGACPLLIGGKGSRESVEEYALRCKKRIDVALERLKEARCTYDFVRTGGYIKLTDRQLRDLPLSVFSGRKDL